MLKKVLAMAVAAAVADVRAETVWIEAESFADWGGWVNDTQFMDQMGSPYLLAHGLGKPVSDATTKFAAKGGEYGVWVRTKNWTAPWSDAAAGCFQVLVDGAAVSCERGGAFGAGPAGWTWQRGGPVSLSAGMHELALRDLTGFDGRCDAVVLTTESDPKATLEGPRPPARVARRTPLPAYDVVVVGGGIAGICAAISSARLGLKTALVHDRPVLGGNNSSEVRVHLGAYANIPPYPRLGDVVAEIGPKQGGNAREAANYEDDRKLKAVKATKGLDLFLNRHVGGVVTNRDGGIAAVVATDTRQGASLCGKLVRRLHRRRDGRVSRRRRLPHGPRGEVRDERAGRAGEARHGHDGRVGAVVRRREGDEG